MTPIIDIPWTHLSFAVIFIVILLGVSLYESLKLERTILLGTFRATVQLILVGFVIQKVFEIQSWPMILVILVVMVFTASQTLIKRLKKPVRGTYTYALIAVSGASLLSVYISSQLIIGVNPWYEARYLIPLGGMIIANGMNGATLAGERYRSELSLRVAEIEMLLSLGFDSRKASLKARQQAITAALLPSLNNMMVLGIVHLPGMMTGQIIAGADPVTAVKYQLVIILSISGTVALTSWIFLSLLDRRYFTPHHQFRYDLIQ